MRNFTWKEKGTEGVIHLGNNLEVIKKVPDRSIQTIITDPPYFLGLTHNGQRGCLKDLNVAEPYYRELFQQMKRVLKADGCVYFFSDWRGYAFYYPIFEEILGAQNLLVWDKGSGPGYYYNFSHELILFHTADSKFHQKGKHGRNVLSGIPGFSCGGTKKANGAKVHPTQKPVEIIEKLMLDSTMEGDTVLDCFSGSGTTCVVAIKNKRNVIAMEITEKYFDISVERAEKELLELKEE